MVGIILLIMLKVLSKLLFYSWWMKNIESQSESTRLLKQLKQQITNYSTNVNVLWSGCYALSYRYSYHSWCEQAFKVMWILIGRQCLLFIRWKNKNRKVIKTKIVPLRHYRYCCGVKTTILVEFEPALKLYSYNTWCEQLHSYCY